MTVIKPASNVAMPIAATVPKPVASASKPRAAGALPSANAAVLNTATAVSTRRGTVQPVSTNWRTKRKPRPTRPKLRFTPTAWAKLKFLRDLGPTDLLLIKDVRLVPQQAHPAFVVFDDHAVADYFDEQVDRDLRPEQFGRIWIHTHPGESPAPSVTDHETFDRVFGATQWSVMFILARHGATHAELRYQAGPSVDGPTGSLL